MTRSHSNTNQPKRPSRDYHDYFLRDGKYVGDYEGMYRFSAVPPWHQDETAFRWYSQVVLAMARDHAPYRSILEVGCGLGFVTVQLQPFLEPQAIRLGRPGAKPSLNDVGIDAFDISPTAIAKASRLHRGVNFYVDDITREDFNPLRRYHLVVVKELFWYVIHCMKDVIRRLNRSFAPAGFF